VSLCFVTTTTRQPTITIFLRPPPPSPKNLSLATQERDANPRLAWSPSLLSFQRMVGRVSSPHQPCCCSSFAGQSRPTVRYPAWPNILPFQQSDKRPESPDFSEC